MGIKLSGFLQWRINIFLYLTMGWWFAKVYLFFIGRLYFFFKHREKETIKHAITDVIGSMDKRIDIERLFKKVIKGILYHYYEKLFLAFQEKEDISRFINSNIECNDLVVLRKSILKRKGVIVITGHYGAIEYIPPLLALNDFDVSVIAKFTTEQLRQRTFSQAVKYNVRFIDGEKTGNILKSAIRELKENRILITQCDEIEEWRCSEREKTSFLGNVTGLDRTINALQKRTGAEIVFALIHRYNLNKYKLLMYSYEDMLAMLANASPGSVGEVVIKFLEQFIYYYPEQWYQWKKYPELSQTPSRKTKTEKASSIPFLQPAFRNVL